jgi:hypothetical protein
MSVFDPHPPDRVIEARDTRLRQAAQGEIDPLANPLLRRAISLARMTPKGTDADEPRVD